MVTLFDCSRLNDQFTKMNSRFLIVEAEAEAIGVETEMEAIEK